MATRLFVIKDRMAVDLYKTLTFVEAIITNIKLNTRNPMLPAINRDAITVMAI